MRLSLFACFEKHYPECETLKFKKINKIYKI